VIAMTVTPAMLGASQALRDMLWPFEFTVTDNQSHGPVWIDVTALQPFEVVGQNGSGGVFALVGDIKHVLHLTSEGYRRRQPAGIPRTRCRTSLVGTDRIGLRR
jgi:hypothetical protein